jgi:cytochrome oxidase Cu insertion factor (SCO1/SenC/PrrC family)
MTDRGVRIYLAVWLVVLAVVVGACAGLLIATHRAGPAPVLGGGVVFKAGLVRAPEFHLRDQSGDVVSPSGLRGRVVALTFLDTQCQQMCPLQASLLGAVQSDLGPKAGPSVLVVSIRPEVDTPANIADYMSSHGLVGELHWVTGSHAELAPIWDEYGIGVQVASGDLTHTSVIYLIDRAGYERVAFADLPDQAAVESDVRLLEQGV